MSGRPGRSGLVLGISAFYHDAAAALVEDGRVAAAAQEERFTRRKGDASFPAHAVRYCLAERGIRLDDLSAVVFHEKPWLHFERLLETSLDHAPRGAGMFVRAVPPWVTEKFFMRRTLRRALDWQGPLLFAEHHESHMAAAFYPSPFERAAILTVDGVGEWTTASFGRGAGSELEVIGELQFPHSLGLLYAAFTAYLGFEVNEGEYKVMGLAPYGEPRYAERILRELVELCDDGSFRLNLAYFAYTHAPEMTTRAFHELFGGPPRTPEGPIEQRHLDLARSIQHVTEEILVRMVRHVHARTGETDLVLGGGVALNSVANGRILREGPFRRLWIQPAAGDAGSAIGCALAAWHRHFGRPRPVATAGDAQHGSLLGPAFSRDDVVRELDRLGARYRKLDDEDLFSSVARLIDEQQVVGWFAGRMEFGPRALGCRSILADARSPSMQSVLNEKIKHREAFRPFAPAVLASEAEDYFEHSGPSPYMLIVAPVRASHRSDIPAVTHVDGSARLQTVDAGTNPRFHGLLEAFRRRTGCAVVVNTSFNVRGEPIVCTPYDAYRCFMRTDMDALVIEDALLLKGEQPPWRGPVPEPSPWSPPPIPEQPRGFGLSVGVLLVALSLFGAWRDGYELDALRAGLLAAGASLLLCAVVLPRWLIGPARLFRIVGERVGHVVTALVLLVVFAVLVTPLGVLRRALSRPTHAGSAWRPRTEPPPRHELQF